MAKANNKAKAKAKAKERRAQKRAQEIIMTLGLEIIILVRRKTVKKARNII